MAVFTLRKSAGGSTVRGVDTLRAEAAGIELDHISSTVVHQPVSAVSSSVNLDHIGSTTAVFAPLLFTNLALGHIASTVLLAPQIATQADLSFIDSTVLFAPSLNGTVEFPHIDPTTTVFALDLQGFLSLDHISSTVVFNLALNDADEIPLPHLSTTTLLAFSVENIIYEELGPARVLRPGGDRVLATY